eukprot:241405-Rhodomonas_salina.2
MTSTGIRQDILLILGDVRYRHIVWSYAVCSTDVAYGPPDQVEPVSEDHVLGLEGYMLFYRLRPGALLPTRRSCTAMRYRLRSRAVSPIVVLCAAIAYYDTVTWCAMGYGAVTCSAMGVTCRGRGHVQTQRRSPRENASPRSYPRSATLLRSPPTPAPLLPYAILLPPLRYSPTLSSYPLSATP